MKLRKTRNLSAKHQAVSTAQQSAAPTRMKMTRESSVHASEPLSKPVPEHVVIHRTFLNAKSVLIAGSFNGWTPSANEVKNCGGDRWRVDLTLKPGRYEYRFVVNEQWTDDPVTHNYVANPFGSHNSVLVVNGPDKSKTETTRVSPASGLN